MSEELARVLLTNDDEGDVAIIKQCNGGEVCVCIVGGYIEDGEAEDDLRGELVVWPWGEKFLGAQEALALADVIEAHRPVLEAQVAAEHHAAYIAAAERGER